MLWRRDENCRRWCPRVSPLQGHRLGRIKLAAPVETAGDCTIRPLQEKAPVGARVTIQGASEQHGGLDQPRPWGVWRGHQAVLALRLSLCCSRSSFRSSILLSRVIQ